MAYRDFKFPTVADDLGLNLSAASLFTGVAPLTPRPELVNTLARGVRLATSIDTEKARSEFVLAPILLEVVGLLNDRYSVFSGVDFNVDPTRGLNGYCDFLLCRDPFQYAVRAPVVTVAETKNDDVVSGFAQCIAGMRAAWLFNAARGTPVGQVFGAATSGTEWKFLRLRDTDLTIDNDLYYVSDPGQILAILVHMATTA